MKRLAPIAESAVAHLLAAAPMTAEKVQFAWRLAVGAALDRATRVELRRARLSVTVDGPAWAREIDRNRDLILARLGRLLGAGTVRALDLDPPP